MTGNINKISSPLTIQVHHKEMDTIHGELAELVEQLANIGEAEFGKQFSELLDHTEAHFSQEERWMQETAYPHISEHRDEHRQVLQEMKQFSKRRLPIARAYVRDRLPERFALHITRVDSMLAAYLNGLK